MHPNHNGFAGSTTKDRIFSELSDLSAISPNDAGLSMSVENLDLAERTARWLYQNQAVHGGEGMTWENENGNLSTTYQDGAAGIGDFFLDLYDVTYNSTYLTWANDVGVWLNYVDTNFNTASSGKWPRYLNELNPQNYTGFLQGSAGIGTYLLNLYSHTHNSTYQTLATEIATELSNAAISSIDGTGERLKLKDYAPHAGPTIQPENTTSASAFTVSEVLGTFDAINNDWDDTAEFTGIAEFDSNSSTEISIANNASLVSDLTISKNIYSGRNADFAVQTFKLSNYPFFVDPTNGVSIRLYTDDYEENGYYLNVSFHEVIDQYGNIGNQIGDTSENWYANEVPKDTEGAFVNFNWTGNDANSPVLNGSSQYGYAIKVNFGDSGVNDGEKYFYLKTTTQYNYNDGLLRWSKNSIISYSYSRDLCFNLTALSTSSSLNLKVGITGNNGFDFQPEYDQKDIINMTLSVLVSSDTALSATAINALQIYNWNNGNWDTIDFFSNSETEISVTYTQPDVRKYVSSAPLFSIQYRLIAGSKTTPISISIRQSNVSMFYSGEKYSLNWGEGVAGVIDFFIDCYETLNSEPYLAQASLFANYILEEAISYQASGKSFAYWEEDGVQSLDKLEGGTGIASALLKVAQYNLSNSSYLDIPVAAARQILGLASSDAAYRLGTRIPGDALLWSSGNPSLQYSGIYNGIAGIGDLLLDIIELTDNSVSDFTLAAQKIGNTLIADYLGLYKTTEGNLIENIDEISFHKSYFNSTEDDITFGSGSAGILQYLSRLQRSTTNTRFAEIVGESIQYYTNNDLSSSNEFSYWNVSVPTNSNSKYGIGYGMAGIAQALISSSLRSRSNLNTAGLAIGTSISDWENHGLDGLAGQGLAYVNLYKSGHNQTYLNLATLIGDNLIAPINWSDTGSASTNYTGYSSGLLGSEHFSSNYLVFAMIMCI